MVSIGIVVVHFGNISMTKNCIRSLHAISSRKFLYHIFLVDNDPRNRLKRHMFSENIPLTLLVSKANNGFAAGVNMGLAALMYKSFDYVFLLNNDATVDADIFSKLVPYFSKDRRLGLLSPVIVYAEDSQKIWCTDGKLHQKLLYTTYPHMNKKISKIDLPEIIYSDFGAAALLIKVEVIKKIGLFDEKYFLFGEDVEWCLRAKKTGFLLAYISQSLVKHSVSATSGEKGTNILTPLGAYLYARNFFYLLKDHEEWFNPFFALFGQICIRAPFYILFRTRSYTAKIAYIKGVVDGLHYLFSRSILPNPYLLANNFSTKIR